MCNLFQSFLFQKRLAFISVQKVQSFSSYYDYCKFVEGARCNFLISPVRKSTSKKRGSTEKNERNYVIQFIYINRTEFIRILRKRKKVRNYTVNFMYIKRTECVRILRKKSRTNKRESNLLLQMTTHDTSLISLSHFFFLRVT